jgi:hypothetical protein
MGRLDDIRFFLRSDVLPCSSSDEIDVRYVLSRVLGLRVGRAEMLVSEMHRVM